MAALTQNRPTDRFGGVDSGILVNRIPVPIADNVHIFQGALVQANATGYATPAGTATTADTSAFTTLGRAYREYDNTISGHTLGALTVEVEQGAFSWDNHASDPVTQAEVGKAVYADDDHTVRKTSDTNTRAVAGKALCLMTLPELGDQVMVQTVSV